MRIDSRIVSISNGKINMGPYHEYMAFYRRRRDIMQENKQTAQRRLYIQKRNIYNSGSDPAKITDCLWTGPSGGNRRSGRRTHLHSAEVKRKRNPSSATAAFPYKSRRPKVEAETRWRSNRKKEQHLIFFQYFSKGMEDEEEVSVYAEDCLRIEISDATDPELQKGIPTRKAYQFDFGARYQYFPGKSMTFLHEVKTANTYPCALNVPKFFWEEAGVKEGDRLDWYRQPEKARRYMYLRKSRKAAN